MSLLVLTVLAPGMGLILVGDWLAFFRRREWLGAGITLLGLAYFVVVASAVLRV